MISYGELSAAEVPSDQTLTITVQYSEGGITKTATMSVLIVDVTPPLMLEDLVISGPDSVNENSFAAYTATAFFSDSSSQVVTAEAISSQPKSLPI